MYIFKYSSCLFKISTYTNYELKINYGTQTSNKNYFNENKTKWNTVHYQHHTPIISPMNVTVIIELGEA